MATLQIQADGTSRRVALEAPLTTVGRDFKAMVRLKDGKASRHHCSIVKQDGRFKLVDGGSSNGTFLNGVQVRESFLTPGDRIQIGMTVLLFENGSPGTARTEKAAPTRATELTPAPTQKATPPPRKTMAAATGAREKASERFVREASRRRANPLVVVVVLCGALLAAATAYQLIPGGGERDVGKLREEVTRLQVAAREAELDWEWAAARRHYEAALTLTEGVEEVRSEAAILRALLRDVDTKEAQAGEIHVRFVRLKKDAGEPQDTRKPAAELADEGHRVLAAIGGSRPPFLAELKKIVGDIEKELVRRVSFHDFRGPLLKAEGEGLLGRVVAAWRTEFLPRAAGGDCAAAEKEIKRINEKAWDLANTAKVRVRDMARSRAHEHLEELLARLAGCDCEQDLRAELKKYE